MRFIPLLFLLACGTPARHGDGGGRDETTGTNDERGGGRDETATTSGYTCWDAGYDDCYNYYEPDEGWWGCTGNAASNDYWDGYCACEYDYDDTYYCY